MILIVISIIISFFISIHLASKRLHRGKVLGIYSSPGKWYFVKYISMLLLFKLRKLSSGLRRGKAGVGYQTKNVDEMEKVQPLSKEKKAFDAVFYQGVSGDGYYFAGGVERRPNAKVNGLVYLLVPEIGLLESEHLPKTQLKANLKDKNSFAGGGISFTPVEPMKKWKISYNGRMWTGNKKKKTWYNVDLKAEFTSEMPHFVIDTDADQKCLARAIAREEWTRKFFEALEKSHQTHYEQMGTIKGTVTINNTKYTLKLQGFRDHSFGSHRDWSLLHRYIFHIFHLENDVRICVGVVSQPCSISHFEIGYILKTDKKMYPIQKTSLKLYSHGENGTLPESIAFVFEANNEEYRCKVDYLPYNAVHYKGSDVEAKLFERFFVGEVNGVKCRGISEWHYNNVNMYKKKNKK